MPEAMTVTAEALGRQLDAILTAWGMPADIRARTVDVMLQADLMGIDSHGVGMLGLYETQRGEGAINMAPEVTVVRESPVTALLDGDSGLGHHASLTAVDMAVDKAKASGLAAVAVRNSAHYGAAGVYALRAAEQGLIGISSSSVWNAAIVPTRAKEPIFGTNPWAFAAPAARHKPFLLDMATSTVAIGKFRLAMMADRPLPVGWALDKDGEPQTDSALAAVEKLCTPLGATPELSSHKGYGLAAMVEILCVALTGSTFASMRAEGQGPADIGHFFLALDPGAFRDAAEVRADVDRLIDRLHGAARRDPDVPVLVPGDKEYASIEDRSRDGIPLSGPMVELISGVAERAGAPLTLDRATA